MAALLLALIAGFLFYSQQTTLTATALSQGRRRGRSEMLAVFAGAIAGDALWVAASLLLLYVTAGLAPLRVIFTIVGAFFFLRLAWSALLDARLGVAPRLDLAERQQGFRSSARVSFTNPYALGFWVGVAATALLFATRPVDPLDHVLVFVGLISGAALWALLMVRLLRFEPPVITRALRVIYLLCGVGAALLGAFVLGTALIQFGRGG
jgi:threonine/homoserine/homoserine lactone efflux protein